MSDIILPESMTTMDFAQSIFYLNGSPLRMPHSSMRHLIPIYNSTSRSILLKFGRQTHKSTTVGYKISIPVLKYPSYHALYVAPTGNQVSTFSVDKLDGSLYGSPLISKHYFNTKTKNQVKFKELTNNSHVYLRSAFRTADGIRGISTDMTVLDEFQDFISDNIPVIEQAMSHSIAKYNLMKEYVPNLPKHLFNNKLYAGTPKTSDNVMEVYWNASTQNEWLIKCQHCGKWNYIGLENIGSTCLVCNNPKCKKPIHYEYGQWVSMFPDAMIESYRMPQLPLKWINNEDAWIEQVIKPIETGAYTTEKVYNEILALPYANAKHPMTTSDIVAVCNSERRMTEEGQAHNDRYVQNGTTVAGIDWGKGDTMSGSSYTVLSIGVMDRNVYRLLYMRKFTGRLSDALLQLDEIKRIITRFRCRLTIADNGDGRTSNAVMVDYLGPDKFAELYEHGTMKKKIKWDKDKAIYLINRTQVMTDLMMEIKNKKVEFFTYDQFKAFKPDFTGIYSEYSEQTRMTKYDHVVPDDCFHAYMFSRVAASILNGEYSKYLIGGE